MFIKHRGNTRPDCDLLKVCGNCSLGDTTPVLLHTSRSLHHLYHPCCIEPRQKSELLGLQCRIGPVGYNNSESHATAGQWAGQAMSDAPVIFKRTKAKANQRAREEPKQDAQDQSVNLTEDEPSPSAVASKIRNKAKQRAKPKTALSFGAEEEVRRSDTHFLNLHPSIHRKEMKKSSKLKSPTSVRN
jgi:hypothetical protein